MTRERNDTMISLHKDVHADLAAYQAKLAGRWGFKPTIAQTIMHLLSIAK